MEYPAAGCVCTSVRLCECLTVVWIGPGRFLDTHCADDILFGNIFDRPLKLPWGFGAVLKFMRYVRKHVLRPRPAPPRDVAMWRLDDVIMHNEHR